MHKQLMLSSTIPPRPPKTNHALLSYPQHVCPKRLAANGKCISNTTPKPKRPFHLRSMHLKVTSASYYTITSKFIPTSLPKRTELSYKKKAKREPVRLIGVKIERTDIEKPESASKNQRKEDRENQWIQHNALQYNTLYSWELHIMLTQMWAREWVSLVHMYVRQ